jgi:hypothetical protein
MKKLAEFLPSEIGDIFACNSTTSSPMVKLRAPEADSAHQIGLKLTFHAVLIVGWRCSTRWWENFGWNFYLRNFYLRNLERFCLWLQNYRSYVQMDVAGGLSASNRSETNLPRCSDCS